MKRALLALLILIGSAFIAHEVYCYFRPAIGETRCTLTWLRTQLNLTPAQFEQISAIHEKHWQEMKKKMTRGNCSAEACDASTKRLIDEVSSVLTPTQREKYAKLVAPCSGRSRDKPKTP